MLERGSALGCALLLAQEEPLNLTARGLWQFLDEGNLPWIGVSSQPVSDQQAQFFRQFVGRLDPLLQYHERLHDFRALGIRFSDDRCLRDSGVLNKGALHIKWADAVP